MPRRVESPLEEAVRVLAAVALGAPPTVAVVISARLRVIEEAPRVTAPYLDGVQIEAPVLIAAFDRARFHLEAKLEEVAVEGCAGGHSHTAPLLLFLHGNSHGRRGNRGGWRKELG